MKMKFYMDVQHIAVNKIYDNCHVRVILKVLKHVGFGVRGSIEQFNASLPCISLS